VFGGEGLDVVVRNNDLGRTKPLSLGGNLRFARRVTGSLNSETLFPGMPSSIRSLYSFMMWGGHSSFSSGADNGIDDIVVDTVEGGVGRSQGEVGTARLAVRKNRSGEAKESNVDAGFANNLFFRAWSVVESHPFQVLLSVSNSDKGVSEVEIAVQSKTASRAMNPDIVAGSCFEAKLSVKAREVARVPPRKEPYIRRGR
jgi:hypothetical protein